MAVSPANQCLIGADDRPFDCEFVWWETTLLTRSPGFSITPAAIFVPEGLWDGERLQNAICSEMFEYDQFFSTAAEPDLQDVAHDSVTSALPVS